MNKDNLFGSDSVHGSMFHYPKEEEEKLSSKNSSTVKLQKVDSFMSMQNMKVKSDLLEI